MQYDLENMSRKDLEKLRSDVDKALATLETRRKVAARKAAEEAAKEHGFSLDDLMAAKASSSKTKNAPKYRNPADPNQTWTGRGRQPGWIKEAIEQGRSIDDFAI